MGQISFEQVLAALEAAVADPTNEEKKARLRRLSDQSFEQTIEEFVQVIKRESQGRR